MHVIYSGRLVRLRPIASKEETLALNAQLRTEPNAHWGPRWWTQARQVKEFENDGGITGASGTNCFVIERIDSGEAVGFESCGLWGPGSICSWFGTSIVPGQRGLGFGTEAKLLMLCFMFESFPVWRAGSDTVVDHWAARRSMEACGMLLEGYDRATHRRDGQWYDVASYVIFRPQWEELPVRQYVKRG